MIAPPPSPQAMALSLVGCPNSQFTLFTRPSYLEAVSSIRDLEICHSVLLRETFDKLLNHADTPNLYKYFQFEIFLCVSQAFSSPRVLEPKVFHLQG
jgi:hypothetical protein